MGTVTRDIFSFSVVFLGVDSGQPGSVCSRKTPKAARRETHADGPRAIPPRDPNGRRPARPLGQDVGWIHRDDANLTPPRTSCEVVTLPSPPRHPLKMSASAHRRWWLAVLVAAVVAGPPRCRATSSSTEAGTVDEAATSAAFMRASVRWPNDGNNNDTTGARLNESASASGSSLAHAPHASRPAFDYTAVPPSDDWPAASMEGEPLMLTTRTFGDVLANKTAIVMFRSTATKRIR